MGTARLQNAEPLPFLTQRDNLTAVVNPRVKNLLTVCAYSYLTLRRHLTVRENISLAVHVSQ